MSFSLEASQKAPRIFFFFFFAELQTRLTMRAGNAKNVPFSIEMYARTLISPGPLPSKVPIKLIKYNHGNIYCADKTNYISLNILANFFPLFQQRLRGVH